MYTRHLPAKLTFHLYNIIIWYVHFLQSWLAILVCWSDMTSEAASMYHSISSHILFARLVLSLLTKSSSHYLQWVRSLYRLCSSLIISYLFLLIYLGTYSESHISVFPHQWVVQEDNHILACKDDCKGCLVACKLQGRYGTLEKLVPWWDSLWNRITTGTLYICACTAY